MYNLKEKMIVYHKRTEINNLITTVIYVVGTIHHSYLK